MCVFCLLTKSFLLFCCCWWWWLFYESPWFCIVTARKRPGELGMFAINKHACTFLRTVESIVISLRICVRCVWSFLSGYRKVSPIIRPICFPPSAGYVSVCLIFFFFHSCTCRVWGLCLSLCSVRFDFMGNILSEGLCEEKIDYPERLFKQEKGNGVELNVSGVALQPYWTPT